MKHYLLLATVLGLLIGCGGESAPPPPPPAPVTVQVAARTTVTSYQTYPGTVVPLEEVQLRAEVTGQVTKILFEEGQTVTKGQQLYEINPRVYRARVGEAQANVARAEADYEQAQRDAERYTRLHKQDAIAKQTFENALTELEAAKTQVAAARATANVAQTNLRFSRITAPFTGTIGITEVELGDLVNAGQTILNTLSTTDPMAVDFEVNEKQLPRLLQLLKQPSDSVFTIRLPDGSDYPAYGTLLLIDRAVSRQTGTIRARLKIPNENNYLRAGMNCTVRVRQRSDKPQLVIPYQAINQQMGEYFVFVVGDSSTVEERRINVARQVGERAVVQSGLEEGERVAVTGIQKLKDGAKVKVKEG
jgi:membrane fusion protein (multidrug efflux system)